MSLAVLARKTRAKQKLRKRGKFILNMTGRGNVLGMNAKMSRGNCKGLTTCAGKRAACCVGVGGSQCCEFPHGGQPAPQQSYRVYLNRKSKGAYRPAGGKQCKDLSGCTSAKSVWKQGSNLDAGEITRKRRDNILACNSDVYTAKKDTCTGCVTSSTSTNTMEVGFGGSNTPPNGVGIFGFNRLPPPPVGTLIPQNVNGVPIVEISYYNDGSIGVGPKALVVALEVTTPPQVNDFFTSISFVDSSNNVRTYSTSLANFSPNPVYAVWIWNLNVTPYVPGDENFYWNSQVGKSLGVIFDGTLGKKCCCPVKKSICGCRSTDVLRYTRINKSFGCQTTKAVRMGRAASEQIARRRAAVDCIKPKHRTIYIDINSDGLLKVNGCCGNQCLIQGQQYTFVFNQLNTSSPFDNGPITIQWCQGVEEKITPPANKDSFSFTVPKFNKNCQPATEAVISTLTSNSSIRLSYCKKAFKTPQMLGSCSGR